MTTYAHIDRIGSGTCAVVVDRDSAGRATDICGCAPYDGAEITEDADGVLVCLHCGHDVREIMADELVGSVR